MSYLPAELLPYLKYLAPPVVGAFIGYLTNRVAIRMLFRPLKAWRLGTIRVPMTPGVIPSKRDELAANMGEVVGDHLLTSKEIGSGLQHEVFQKHLYSLIREKIEMFLQKDLGNLASTVPEKFKAYFKIGVKTLRYQLKDQLHTYVQSEEFEQTVDRAVERRLELLLEQDIENLLTVSNRKKVYQFLETNISRMFESEEMERWIAEFIHSRIYITLQEEKSLKEVLPDSISEMFEEMLLTQVPHFLGKIGGLVAEPDVREKIVSGACGGVEAFIDSLGSMADMVRNFLPMETVETKIREYLEEKNDAIVSWLQSEEVQLRVATILRERSREFLARPVVEYIDTSKEATIDAFCEECARQVLLLLRVKAVSRTLGSMFQENIENHLEEGRIPFKKMLEGLIGEQSLDAGRGWLKNEIRELLQAHKTMETIDIIIDSLFDSLLKRRIGKLTNLIPLGIRDGWSRSLQKMASTMLENEVPGLVQSLNIRQIVTEKINSLDILRLERLLLSIMEEQFKYINLFGALLGFLIGCLNIFIIYGL